MTVPFFQAQEITFDVNKDVFWWTTTNKWFNVDEEDAVKQRKVGQQIFIGPTTIHYDGQDGSAEIRAPTSRTMDVFLSIGGTGTGGGAVYNVLSSPIIDSNAGATVLGTVGAPSSGTTVYSVPFQLLSSGYLTLERISGGTDPFIDAWVIDDE